MAIVVGWDYGTYRTYGTYDYGTGGLWDSAPCPVVAHIYATSAPVARNGGEMPASQAGRLRYFLNPHHALLSLPPVTCPLHPFWTPSTYFAAQKTKSHETFAFHGFLVFRREPEIRTYISQLLRPHAGRFQICRCVCRRRNSGLLPDHPPACRLANF